MYVNTSIDLIFFSKSKKNGYCKNDKHSKEISGVLKLNRSRERKRLGGVDVGRMTPDRPLSILLGPLIIRKALNMVKVSQLVDGSILHSRFSAIQITANGGRYSIE